MNERKLMNLEKGHELDPIWSEFNPAIRVLIQDKLKKTAIWYNDFFGFLLFFHSLYFFVYFCLQCQDDVYLTVEFYFFEFAWQEFRPWSMMKPSWVCSQLVSLRKAPLCAETLEIKFFWWNKILLLIIQQHIYDEEIHDNIHSRSVFHSIHGCMVKDTWLPVPGCSHPKMFLKYCQTLDSQFFFRPISQTIFFFLSFSFPTGFQQNLE